MAWCRGQCLPCGFILLGGKKQATYIRMLKELKAAALLIKCELRPEYVILDFEIGAIHAFEYEFPSAKIVGFILDKVCSENWLNVDSNKLIKTMKTSR